MSFVERKSVARIVEPVIIRGHATDLLAAWDKPLDLIVTDPPYAFGGSGEEHAISATVAVALREAAKHLVRGSWMVVLCASSYRSISYMVEALRGVVEPVRIGTWVKPSSRTKVVTAGWAWTSVAAIAFRKGQKNRTDISKTAHLSFLDWIQEGPVFDGRRAELPMSVGYWAVKPFAIQDGIFLDPFAGSGVLPIAAAHAGMQAFGFELKGNEDAEESEIILRAGRGQNQS